MSDLRTKYDCLFLKISKFQLLRTWARAYNAISVGLSYKITIRKRYFAPYDLLLGNFKPF